MCYKLHTHTLDGFINSLTTLYNCDIYSFVFMTKTFHVGKMECLDWKHCI